MDDDYDIYGGLGEFELHEQKKEVSIRFKMCVFVLTGSVCRICQLEIRRASYKNNKIICIVIIQVDRENADLRHQVEKLEIRTSQLVAEKEHIEKEYKVSLMNLSSLLEAARRELKRKEEQIKQKAKELVTQLVDRRWQNNNSCICISGTMICVFEGKINRREVIIHDQQPRRKPETCKLEPIGIYLTP